MTTVLLLQTRPTVYLVQVTHEHTVVYILLPKDSTKPEGRGGSGLGLYFCEKTDDKTVHTIVMQVTQPWTLCKNVYIQCKLTGF